MKTEERANALCQTRLASERECDITVNAVHTHSHVSTTKAYMKPPGLRLVIVDWITEKLR